MDLYDFYVVTRSSAIVKLGSEEHFQQLHIYHLRPHDHITDALATLHWLRVPERVQYKIAVLKFKVLHDSAPRYLAPLVTVADLPGRRALRSASTSRLVIPPIKLSTVGSCAFPVAAAQVWNSLPEAGISSSSLQTFRR